MNRLWILLALAFFDLGSISFPEPEWGVGTEVDPAKATSSVSEIRAKIPGTPGEVSRSRKGHKGDTESRKIPSEPESSSTPPDRF